MATDQLHRGGRAGRLDAAHRQCHRRCPDLVDEGGEPRKGRAVGLGAAACIDEVTAELSRRHNDLNVLCLSGDLLSSRVTERVVEVWMDTEFEGGRHKRRIDKISALEKANLVDGAT